jgi:hypothetical protein
VTRCRSTVTERRLVSSTSRMQATNRSAMEYSSSRATVMMASAPSYLASTRSSSACEGSTSSEHPIPCHTPRGYAACLAGTRPRTRRGPGPDLAATHPPPLVRHLGHEDPRDRHPRRRRLGRLPPPRGPARPLTHHYRGPLRHRRGRAGGDRRGLGIPVTGPSPGLRSRWRRPRHRPPSTPVPPCVAVPPAPNRYRGPASPARSSTPRSRARRRGASSGRRSCTTPPT